jgi:hypothetical protein
MDKLGQPLKGSDLLQRGGGVRASQATPQSVSTSKFGKNNQKMTNYHTINLNLKSPKKSS